MSNRDIFGLSEDVEKAFEPLKRLTGVRKEALDGTLGNEILADALGGTPTRKKPRKPRVVYPHYPE